MASSLEPLPFSGHLWDSEATGAAAWTRQTDTSSCPRNGTRVPLSPDPNTAPLTGGGLSAQRAGRSRGAPFPPLLLAKTLGDFVNLPSSGSWGLLAVLPPSSEDSHWDLVSRRGRTEGTRIGFPPAAGPARQARTEGLSCLASGRGPFSLPGRWVPDPRSSEGWAPAHACWPPTLGSVPRLRSLRTPGVLLMAPADQTGSFVE